MLNHQPTPTNPHRRCTPGDYRIAVLGSAGVGKTCLVQRLTGGAFREGHAPTVEDTYCHLAVSEGHLCTLHIIDTSGARQFPAMSRLAMARSDAFMLVYSVTSRSSLAELAPVLAEIREVRGQGAERPPGLLVGNKSDASVAREVSAQAGAAVAAAWDCGAFRETSARDDVAGVREAFGSLLAMDGSRRLLLLEEDGRASRMSRRRRGGSGGGSGGGGGMRCAAL